MKELIAILAQEDPEAEVVLSRDPEGNGFSTCDGYSLAMWDAEDREIYDIEENLDEDERDQDGLEPAVVLWP